MKAIAHVGRQFPQLRVGRSLPFLARRRPKGTGRACPLCPSISDVNLFRYGKRVVNLNAQISNGAFDFCVAQQELHSAQVAGPSVDQSRLRSAQ